MPSNTPMAVWGDGSPTREFLYVADAAEGIVRAAEGYNASEPVNLGSGEEIAISTLVEIIAEQTGFRGEIRWDVSKPNGQPRRKLATSRAQKYFDFVAQTPFAQGLRQTIDWYQSTEAFGAIQETTQETKQLLLDRA